MPLPKPKKGQSKKDFVSEHMDDAKLIEEFPDEKQRAAVLYDQFKGNKRKRKIETKETFQRLRVNISACLREEEYEGRRYIVAPVIMLKEGILNNIYYPEYEIAKIPDAWNGRPLVINHPENDIGEFISANDPDVLKEYSVGQIFNAHYENGKLKAEAWIDYERLKEKDPDLMDRIEANEIIEVSTGLFVDEEEVFGEFDGIEYDSIAHNFRPDHLAILPNDIGACSVADGAGLCRTNSEQGREKIYRNYQNTFTPNSMSFSDIREKLSSSSQGWVVDVYDGEFIYELWDENTDNYLLYKQTYIKEDDTVTVTGVPTKVERKVSYEVVTNEMQTQEDPEMDKAEKIEAIIANASNSFEEADREFLEGLEEEKLDKMSVKAETPVQGNSKNTETPEDKTSEPATGLSAEAIERMVEKQVEKRLATNKANEIIGRLTANKDCKFSKETLLKMNVEELQKIENDLTPADYSGAGGFNVNESVPAESEPLSLPNYDEKSE